MKWNIQKTSCVAPWCMMSRSFLITLAMCNSNIVQSYKTFQDAFSGYGSSKNASASQSFIPCLSSTSAWSRVALTFTTNSGTEIPQGQLKVLLHGLPEQLLHSLLLLWLLKQLWFSLFYLFIYLCCFRRFYLKLSIIRIENEKFRQQSPPPTPQSTQCSAFIANFLHLFEFHRAARMCNYMTFPPLQSTNTLMGSLWWKGSSAPCG